MHLVSNTSDESADSMVAGRYSHAAHTIQHTQLTHVLLPEGLFMVQDRPCCAPPRHLPPTSAAKVATLALVNRQTHEKLALATGTPWSTAWQAPPLRVPK